MMGAKNGRGWVTRGVSDRTIKVQAMDRHRELDPQGLLKPEVMREFIRACICPYCGEGPFKSLPNHTVHQHDVYARDLRAVAGIAPKVRVASEEFGRHHVERWNAMTDEEKVERLSVLNPEVEFLREASHGDRLNYQRGCKCDECRAANAAHAMAAYDSRPRKERTQCKRKERTQCKYGHDLNEDNRYWATDYWACRICRRESALRSYHRSKGQG